MARAFLRRVAEQWGVDDELAQDAAMVITELVANAVDHARTESTLSLGVTQDGLRVAVRDTRPDPVPRPAPIDPTAPRGRGLQMVDALTTAWGVTMHAGGKTVWAVLGAVRD
jgi:anti-sigma regulatory factor (Ser/Thr protein kinase)